MFKETWAALHHTTLLWLCMAVLVTRQNPSWLRPWPALAVLCLIRRITSSIYRLLLRLMKGSYSLRNKTNILTKYGKKSFDWGTGFVQTLLLKGFQSFWRLITNRSYASAIRVYQIWAVRHLSTPWTGTQPKMKTKTCWVCHHGSLDIHSAWPLNTQQWKRKWKLLTLSQLHQSFINDIQGWVKFKMKENGP